MHPKKTFLLLEVSIAIPFKRREKWNNKSASRDLEIRGRSDNGSRLHILLKFYKRKRGERKRYAVILRAVQHARILTSIIVVGIKNIGTR
jgi:hypothetical protein